MSKDHLNKKWVEQSNGDVTTGVLLVTEFSKNHKTALTRKREEIDRRSKETNSNDLESAHRMSTLLEFTSAWRRHLTAISASDLFWHH
jgi:hypothetical protein